MIKNSLFSIANNLLQLLVSVFSAYFIARGLGVYGKGELYLITQIYVIFQLSFSFGLGQSILYNIKTGGIPANRIKSFIFCFLFLVLIILSVIYLNGDKIISKTFGLVIGDRETILMLVISLIGVANLLFGYELMSDPSKIVSTFIISIASNLSYLLSLLYFFYFSHLTVISVLTSLLISITLKAFLTFRALNIFRTRFTFFNLSDVKKLFSYGPQFFLNSFFLTMVSRIDTFFLSHYNMVEELGIYSVAVTLSELVLVVPSAIGVVLFPFLSGLNQMDQISIVKVSSRINLMIGILFALFFVFMGSYVIDILFGNQFSESYNILICLLPGIVAMTFSITFSNYLSSIGKPLLGTSFYVASTVLNVILNSLFTSYYGLYAVSIIASLSYILTTMLFVRYVLLNGQISLKDLTILTKADVVLVTSYIKLLRKK